MQRLRCRGVCAGSFSVSRFAKAHPVSRLDSDPLPQVGMGLPEGSLLSRRLSLPPRAPYEAQGKALAAFAGYLRHKAAMHPSVCALRRIHRPVCGARIARRALKHACALRPLHYREAAKTGAVSD